ncbi:hypothetical protein HWI79_2683 [Cryptosporidium felis]|nr:hypothetical protein HWI79_2683 [Cryptosporidium felis]
MRSLGAQNNRFSRKNKIQNALNWRIRIIFVFFLLKSFRNGRGEVLLRYKETEKLKLGQSNSTKGELEGNDGNILAKNFSIQGKILSQPLELEDFGFLGLQNQTKSTNQSYFVGTVTSKEVSEGEEATGTIQPNGPSTASANRKMAEYELIHRDPVAFRPFGYHEFVPIPHVFHQIPQNQYPMFRSGYLEYPYNPIHYYRSPYITTIKKNRTRILREDASGDAEKGYRVEYEIMEFLSGKNNSIFN